MIFIYSIKTILPFSSDFPNVCIWSPRKGKLYSSTVSEFIVKGWGHFSFSHKSKERKSPYKRETDPSFIFISKYNFLSHIVFQPSVLFISRSIHSFVYSLRQQTETTVIISYPELTVDNIEKQLNTLGWIYWPLINVHYYFFWYKQYHFYSKNVLTYFMTF